jgi:hypothetical protein
MGGKGHSDDSEGKEVSDSNEKAASDGSEGSEAKECNDKTTEVGRIGMVDFDMGNCRSFGKNPLSIFEF